MLVSRPLKVKQLAYPHCSLGQQAGLQNEKLEIPILTTSTFIGPVYIGDEKFFSVTSDVSEGVFRN